MHQQLVQINFNFTNTDIEFEAAASAVAKIFAEIPGLQWKIWLFNKEKKEAGGIYLFVDKQHADAYIKSDLFKKISTNPKYGNFSFKQFGILDQPGIFTGAPVSYGLNLKTYQ